MAYAMATPKEHIEKIRRNKFSIGCEVINPLTEELHETVKLLSAELYAKDVHFLMELIQNAEDNEYPEGVDPSLEFVITSRDITGTGALATLLMFNNENGFSAKNIESICSVGKSTKKGKRKRGYIGEKGIGFKSVFLITAQPYIFSNGYQIKFTEDPCPHCSLGYIVPDWVNEKPSLSDIQKLYGPGSKDLPTTTLVLPLKPDKVKPVKQQLSRVHPELLLFLSKIKRLSVREDNEDPLRSTVSEIAINSETNFVTRKNFDAESYILHLAANGDRNDEECSYYMWRQRFPVNQENKVERRMDIEEWVITLAFPNGERLQRGTTSPGIYAFLPTEMVTNFPFIIQADFLLASSRETILLDNKWNQGILSCVSSAFINALISLVKMTEDAPVSSLPPMFRFLPVDSSSYPQLNAVRESIRAKLAEEDIVPSESCMEQKFFHRPREVGRLMPRFWDILEKAKVEGVSLRNLSHHGLHVLNSSFDREEYDPVLNFMGVGPVNLEWYAKCIQSSNLVLGVSEEVYLELLAFLAENWSSKFCNTNIGNIPLIKYVDLDGNVALCSINASRQSYRIVCLSPQLSWLIACNKEFRCAANSFFMPKSTYDAVLLCSQKEVVLQWLKNWVKVATVTAYDYAAVLVQHLQNERKLAVAFAYFLYHSLSEKYLSSSEVDYLCGLMPLVDNYGAVSTKRNRVLVPANGSKWAELIVSNPWRQEGYVELGEDYMRPGNFAGRSTTGKQIIEFLKSHVGASDIPHLSPPNAWIPAASAPLTKQNTFFLLDWIKNLKYKGIGIPQKFLACIKEGSWLKITMNGSPDYRPPSQSFFFTSSLGNILQNGPVLIDIPLVDQSFYGESINKYKEELKIIGVMFEYGEACEFIGKRLMSLAASFHVTRKNLFSLLHFIRFLTEKRLSVHCFIQSIRQGRWLKTSNGYMSPVKSVLYNQEWKIASQISDIPFIDQNYYGEEILTFKVELQLIGVLVEFNQNYQLVIDHLKLPSSLTCLTAEAVHLVLACVPHSKSSDKLVNALGNTKCMKTDAGYMSPGECYLSDPKWGCLLEVFNCFPVIDQNFYGSTIVCKKMELQKLGVAVEFEKAVKAFVLIFKQQASTSSISKDNVLKFLACYRQLKGTSLKFPAEFIDCTRESKWLRTRLGDYRSPRDCILFGPDWKSISSITLLPFIDDSDRFYSMAIHDRKLLSFFSSAFGVKFNPSVDDYCKLWKVWESSGQKLSNAKCCAFWRCVLKQCSSKTDKLIADSLVKLPVNSGSDGILLFDKRDVFLADDLLLKDVIEKSSTHLLFVWYPQPSLPAIPQTMLLELYKKIGVRTISDSVQKEEISLREGVGHKQVNPKDYCIGKGLVKLILGYLADPSIQMEPAKRRDAIKCLLNLTVLETAEPITIRYTLSLSSGDIVDARACQMIRWDRKSGKLFAQKIGRSGGHKNLIEYATQFAEVISKGMLWDREDHINSLSELIKLAFLVEFNEEAVGYLMKSKNMQIFMEDEEFLSAAFPSG